VEPRPNAPVGHLAPDGDRSLWLVAYFRSGWAFFIPYLAVYLLYAATGWPVNPGHTGSWVPSLLHVYWALHVSHLILAIIALRAWWKQGQGQGAKSEAQSASSPSAVLRSPATEQSSPALGSSPSSVHRLLSIGYRLLPWLALAIVFWIPRTYLEYPADPYEHYARINDWSRQAQVTSHIVWFKSSYFWAYSLIGRIDSPSLQLTCLDLYGTACSLLLCLQYFRLARAVGLGDRPAFLYVLLQAIAMGNNIFGFYRYYDISSTIFAQLGVVVVVLATLEHLRDFTPRVLLRTGIATAAPLALIAVNHEQGLALAALGFSSLVVHRLIRLNPSVAHVLALAGVALVLSVAVVLWYPRHAAIDGIYREQGWLTSWYGFNLWSPASPAFPRTAAVLGFTGVLSLAAAACLLHRNHPAAWLTLFPILALLLPAFTIPLTNGLAWRRAFPEEEIVLFQRMLLAIPNGLALVALGPGMLRETRERLMNWRPLATASPGFGVLLFALAAFVTVPAGYPYYNRFWHAVMTVPDDLTLRASLAEQTVAVRANPNPAARILSSAGVSFIFNAAGADRFSYPKRLIRLRPTSAPSDILPWVLEYSRVSLDEGADVRLVVPQSCELFTSGSLAAQISGHWLPYEVALEYAGGTELERQAKLYTIQGKMIAVSPFLYRVVSPPTQSFHHE
jgi:hypothetical protein